MEKKNSEKKDVAKAYEKYASKFTPKPHYLSNCVKAFLVGGSICVLAAFIENKLIILGFNQDKAGTSVTIILICMAQLLTGIGIFDSISKFAGAGIIIPITGFANSMVSPALEYKKEGIVLGVGAKLFSLSGPVLVCGISVATLIGVIYWIVGVLT